ncbi:MAG: hypothetical protein ACK5L3_03250 [Oscillospiraceae bacterium]
METQKNMELSLFCLVCDREKHAKMLGELKGRKSFFCLTALGKGTATSPMLNYLGLGQPEKTLVIAVMPTEVAQVVIQRLDDVMELHKPGRGVAFLAPIHEGCYHRIVNFSRGKNEGDTMENKYGHDVIMVVLERGFTEEVMQEARKAGATGGTVLHARSCGGANIEKFFGITIQPEKAVLMIVSQVEDTCAIMQAIADKHGPGTSTNAVSFSMPVSNVRGIGSDVPESVL